MPLDQKLKILVTMAQHHGNGLGKLIGIDRFVKQMLYSRLAGRSFHLLTPKTGRQYDGNPDPLPG